MNAPQYSVPRRLTREAIRDMFSSDDDTNKYDVNIFLFCCKKFTFNKFTGIQLILALDIIFFALQLSVILAKLVLNSSLQVFDLIVLFFQTTMMIFLLLVLISVCCGKKEEKTFSVLKIWKLIRVEILLLEQIYSFVMFVYAIKVLSNSNSYSEKWGMAYGNLRSLYSFIQTMLIILIPVIIGLFLNAVTYRQFLSWVMLKQRLKRHKEKLVNEKIRDHADVIICTKGIEEYLNALIQTLKYKIHEPKSETFINKYKEDPEEDPSENYNASKKLNTEPNQPNYSSNQNNLIKIWDDKKDNDLKNQLSNHIHSDSQDFKYSSNEQLYDINKTENFNYHKYEFKKSVDMQSNLKGLEDSQVTLNLQNTLKINNRKFSDDTGVKSYIDMKESMNIIKIQNDSNLNMSPERINDSISKNSFEHKSIYESQYNEDKTSNYYLKTIELNKQNASSLNTDTIPGELDKYVTKQPHRRSNTGNIVYLNEQKPGNELLQTIEQGTYRTNPTNFVDDQIKIHIDKNIEVSRQSLDLNENVENKSPSQKINLGMSNDMFVPKKNPKIIINDCSFNETPKGTPENNNKYPRMYHISKNYNNKNINVSIDENDVSENDGSFGSTGNQPIEIDNSFENQKYESTKIRNYMVKYSREISKEDISDPQRDSVRENKMIRSSQGNPFYQKKLRESKEKESKNIIMKSRSRSMSKDDNESFEKNVQLNQSLDNTVDKKENNQEPGPYQLKTKKKMTAKDFSMKITKDDKQIFKSKLQKMRINQRNNADQTDDKS